MKATPTAIPEVVVLEPQVFGDARGFFFESFHQEKLEKALGRPLRFVPRTMAAVSATSIAGLMTGAASGLAVQTAETFMPTVESPGLGA